MRPGIKAVLALRWKVSGMEASVEAGRLSRDTLTSQLVDVLESDIVFGVLGSGRQLNLRDMARTYGVSQTPLREALNRLEVLELVHSNAGSGWSVATVSLDDLKDVYRAMQVLEPVALAESLRRGDERWLRRVQTAWSALRAESDQADALAPDSGTPGGADEYEDNLRETARAYARAHRKFHSALFSACDSAWIKKLIGMLYRHSERYRMMSFRLSHADGHYRDATREHEEIFRAAIARDEDAAARAIIDHYETTVRLMERVWSDADGEHR